MKTESKTSLLISHFNLIVSVAGVRFLERSQSEIKHNKK